MLDNFRKTRIVWDRASNIINQPVRVSSTDEHGRTMEVQVLDGPNKPNLSGVNLNLAWETDGGHYVGLDVFDRTNAKEGLFTLFYTTEMLSHSGKLKANLQLVDKIGTVTSEPFEITVFNGLDREGVQSSNSYTTLTKALAYVSNIDELIGDANTLKEGMDLQFTELSGMVNNELGDMAGITSATRDKVDNLEARVIRENTELKSQIASILASTVSETGSNSQGSWVKRADGTMEVTMRARIKGPLEPYGELFFGYMNPRNMNFPQRFKNPPTLSFSADRYNWFFVTSSVTGNGIVDAVGYRAYDGTSLDETWVTITAHGHWDKAPAKGFALQDTSLYPEYWRGHVESKIDRVVGLQAGGRDRMSFGFITDMHMEGNAGNSFGIMQDIIEKAGITTFINGGDQANNGVNALKGRAISQIEQMFHGFAPIQDKMLNAMGNHDDNSISSLWSETMKHDELYSRLFRYMGNKVVYGPTGKYFYKDDLFHKVRYIVLDSIDIPYIKEGTGLKYRGQTKYAFRQEQLDWFAKKALDTPSGYSVVVTSHVPVYETGVVGMDNNVRNSILARGILRAYKMGRKYTASSSDNVEADLKASVNVDFTGKGGDVIAWFGGHVHTDNVVIMPDNIPMITTLNDSAKPWGSAPARSRGTVSEHAFDIVTVDKGSRKIYLTRIGAGKDRIVSY